MKVQDAYAQEHIGIGWIERYTSSSVQTKDKNLFIYCLFLFNYPQQTTYIMDWKVQDAYEGIQWSGSYTADRKVQYEWGGLGLIVQYPSPTNYLYDGLEGLGCIARMDMDGELRMDRKVQYG